jgi:LuxR family maltose regulon positive regulatory protein
MRPGLTHREKEVIALVANGYADKEIAQTLFISTATVRTHLKNSYRKLNVCNRVQAVCKQLWQNIPASDNIF